MLVDHLASVDQGGAAIAARRIHRAVRQTGIESRFWCARCVDGTAAEDGCRSVQWREPVGEAWSFHSATAALAAWSRRLRARLELQRALSGRGPGFEQFTVPWRGKTPGWNVGTMGADILHLHWIATLIDQPSLFATLPAELPIVWTVHDMNPLTGGCHYAGDCEAFTCACRDCPQLGRRGATDLSNRVFHAKRRALEGKNVHLVTPSRWLEREARRSRVLAGVRSCRTIRYGLDTTAFSPRPQVEARHLLGLPNDRVIVAFGADSVDNPRKGFAAFLRALSLLEDRRRIVAVVFGRRRRSVELGDVCPLVDLGHTTDGSRLATIYSAADVMVVPSSEEICGQTGLEAMACGTPVAAFAVGGIPEYVHPFDTGLLAHPGDPADLARQIGWLVAHPAERQRLGHNARTLIRREFDASHQGQAYARLYSELLDAASLPR